MFAVEGNLMLQGRVFSSNIVDYLVGDSDGKAEKLKFMRCSVEVSSFTDATTRGIEMDTTVCAVGGYPLTLTRTCFIQITATEIPAENKSGSSNLGIMIGSVVGGGLGVIIVVIVMGCFCHRKNRRVERIESLESDSKVQERYFSITPGQKQWNQEVVGQMEVPTGYTNGSGYLSNWEIFAALSSF
jgi:hypothetical protein